MENIDKVVSALYDSLFVINQLNAIVDLAPDGVDELSRNKEHLNIMLEKEEVVNALSPEQYSELDTARL